MHRLGSCLESSFANFLEVREKWSKAPEFPSPQYYDYLSLQYDPFGASASFTSSSPICASSWFPSFASFYLDLCLGA